MSNGTAEDQQVSCVLGMQNKTRLDNMEKQIGVVFGAIEDIRDKLLGRPTWIVLFALGGMSSLSVGLIVFMLTHFNKVTP